jgi:hypothetical protein
MLMQTKQAHMETVRQKIKPNKAEQTRLRAKIATRERRLAKHEAIIRVLRESVTQSRSLLTANRPIQAPQTSHAVRTSRQYQEGVSLLRGYQHLLTRRMAQRDAVEMELRELWGRLDAGTTRTPASNQHKAVEA